jgi:hypothetical protein
MRLRLGASGAEKLCTLGAIRRFCAAPQLHRYVSCMIGSSSCCRLGVASADSTTGS